MAKDSKRGADLAYDHYHGMTIREAFAMASWPTPMWILESVRTASGGYGPEVDRTMRQAAANLGKWRVMCADTLLAALAEGKP